MVTNLTSLQVICNGTDAKIDGSFVATVLETASVVVLYLAWRSITEGEQFFGPFTGKLVTDETSYS